MLPGTKRPIFGTLGLFPGDYLQSKSSQEPFCGILNLDETFTRPLITFNNLNLKEQSKIGHQETGIRRRSILLFVFIPFFFFKCSEFWV